ncbi:hypothetical protein PXK01_11740 [Phaeobacter sp. PT47_59]|uniref:hypothetical protein n=2 Tax=Phaeobacter TaxID=302485 RepID=UPI002380568A|nr:hypothetical protein [Phaeobacter sp. PT47_59]MDE4174831.1 hypothetical protein [Phaeobacter sp. PT47_59]
MTEITASQKTPFPLKAANRHLVDPVAFFIAMIGGPLLLGIAGLPTIIAPFATVMGGPVYLIVGIPVMLVYMAQHRVTPYDWAWLAFVTHLAVFLPIFLIAVLTKGNVDGSSIYLIFGCFFAPVWGCISGVLYARLERDFYKQTL